MKFTRPDRQNLTDIAAWAVAAYLVLALVNAFSGAAPEGPPSTPALVHQPGSTPGDLGQDAMLARTAKKPR